VIIAYVEQLSTKIWLRVAAYLKIFVT